MKKIIQHASFLFCLSFLVHPIILAQCGRDSVLQLGTGTNWQGGSHYTANQKDEYWAITNGPIGSSSLGFNYDSDDFPRCAVSHGWTGTLGSFPGVSTVIGYSTGVVDANYKIYAIPCANPHSPYVFQRKFQVDLGGITTPVAGTMELYFDVGVLGFIQQGELISPSGVVTELSAFQQCDPVSPPLQFNGSIGNLENGIYTLKFKTRQYSILGTGGNSPNAQYFEVRGQVKAANQQKVFVDNNHFGKNVIQVFTKYCAPAYPPSTHFQIIGDHCITAPNTQATFDITPFYNDPGQNVYSITGPGNPVITTTTDALGIKTGHFLVGVGTYTITSTESLGCHSDSILKVYNSPTLTVSPTAICIPYGTSTQIDLNPSPGVYSDYGWQINSDPTISLFVPI